MVIDGRLRHDMSAARARRKKSLPPTMQRGKLQPPSPISETSRWMPLKSAPASKEGVNVMTATDKKKWYRSWRLLTAITLVVSVGLGLACWPLIPSKTEWKSQNQQGDFLTAITSISRENDLIFFDYSLKDRKCRTGDIGKGHVRFQFWDAAGKLTEVSGPRVWLGYHAKLDVPAGWLGMRHDTKIKTFELQVPPRAELFAVSFDLSTNYYSDVPEIVLSTKPVPLPPSGEIGKAFDRRKLDQSGDPRQMDPPDGTMVQY
jgi:hypothetical protein